MFILMLIYVCLGSCGRKRMLDLLEIELHSFMSYLLGTYMTGNGIQSSARAASALDYRIEQTL